MIYLKMKIKTPTVPNFLIIEMPAGKKQEGFTESPKVRVGDLPDEHLLELADEWKRDFLAKAKRQRNEE